MNHGLWPMVALGDLLKKSEATVEIQPDSDYKQITVRLWGQGVVLRDEVSGAQIREGKRYVAHSGQFILSRIDARNGAFGLVPESLDGAVISNDFPVFSIDTERLVPRFLEWLSKTQNFVDSCSAASEGTTNRVRLQISRFLATRIPLPPLTEQRRIVARIEALASKVEAARRLREAIAEETKVLWQSQLQQTFRSLEMRRTLENACELIIDTLHSTPKYDGDDFPCIRSQDVSWGTISYETARRVSEQEFVHRIQRDEPQKGDIVFVREGDVGRCGVADGVHRFCLCQRVMLFRPIASEVDPKFLMYQLMSPPILQEQIFEGIKGTTSKHVNIQYLRKVNISIPSLPEQHRIVAHLDALQARLAAVQAHQAATQARLEALLPSILDRAFRGEL
ncbi:MAG: restriction endonuclease subunit S [Anaerolineae bacterium]|nr:restriction endonuclease subunit S [Anaerolineae bacterium]